MENSTEIVSFVLTMYADIGNLVYLYFPLALLLYVSVVLANTVLVVIIYLDGKLHKPMYLFLCCLSVNQIYGNTSLMPCLMVQMLLETHEISKVYCFIQIFVLHTYCTVEFGTLTVMAYDRYVCICQPLHYNSKITTRKVKIVIFIIWTATFVEIGFLLSFTVRLKFCGNLIHKVFCDNQPVAELSCSPDRTMSYLYDLFFGLTLSFVALCFIMFTYGKILAVCLKGSTETKLKAFETCSPHFISIMSFIFMGFYNLISQRFNMTFVPFELRVVLSVYGIIIQPLVSPIIYGFQLSKIRHTFIKFMLSCKM
ncbi:olfactory receptor 4E2-like [Nelusetta ayraudi]|uniref:olfactory receptor 4E2-like n=1 Tax=Nelusetta ayraudi TaxID=303726 RepID=UPI003F6F4BA4